MFVLAFFLTSNWDCRLVFLMLCAPVMARQEAVLRYAVFSLKKLVISLGWFGLIGRPAQCYYQVHAVHAYVRYFAATTPAWLRDGAHSGLM